jgi:hypothetical protein
MRFRRDCHQSTLSLSCEGHSRANRRGKPGLRPGEFGADRPFCGGDETTMMAATSEDEMRKRLELLKVEHRDLDAAIDALTDAGSSDQLQIARMKKRKLKLKDQITLIEDYLIPDIIA